MLDITEIKNVIDQVLADNKINVDDLVSENGNYIYYQNGNDGTEFDATVNDMTCEFFVFYKETEFGAVKLNLIDTNKYRVFVYDKNMPQEVLDRRMIESSLDFRETCEYLFGSLDCKDIYDKPISNWNLTDTYFILWDEDEEDF